MRILKKLKISILTLLITIGGALTIASTINKNHDGHVLSNSDNTSLIVNRLSFLEETIEAQPTQFESIKEYESKEDLNKKYLPYILATISILIAVILILVVTTIMLIRAKINERRNSTKI